MRHLKLNEVILRGKECFERGEYNKAMALFNEVIETESEDKKLLSEAFFHLANIFHIKGDIGKAIKAFNKVLLFEPNHTDASISLSVLYNDIGHYEDAKKVFEKANQRVKASSSISNQVEDQHINGRFAQKHYELAEMYLTYHRYDEALFEYNKVINLDPSFMEARLKVAKVYAKKNFLSKAFDELRSLKNEFPEYLPARVSLGILFYGNGKILEAQNEWEKVISKDSNNKEALMYLNLSRTATETSY